MSAIFESGLWNKMPDLQTVGLCLQTVRHRSTNCPTNFSMVPTNRHYCMRTYLIQNTLNTVCRVCRNNPTVCRTVCRTVCTDMNTVCRAAPNRGQARAMPARTRMAVWNTCLDGPVRYPKLKRSLVLPTTRPPNELYLNTHCAAALPQGHHQRIRQPPAANTARARWGSIGLHAPPSSKRT